MGEDFEPQSNTTSEALDYSKKMLKERGVGWAPRLHINQTAAPMERPFLSVSERRS
jgi:hypothetical protein